MSDDRQVRPAQRGTQVRAGGAAAPALAHRHVHTAEALLLKAVDVRAARIAHLLAGGEPRRVQRVAHRSIARHELAGIAAVPVATLLPALRALEIRQHVAVRPSLGPFLRPPLEILGIAADIDETVDRRRAAQHLAAGGMQAPAVKMRLGLGVIEPVVLRHVHRNGERRGHLDVNRAVGAAILEQEHAVPPIRAQPIRQYAARRTRSDDDIVELLLRQDRLRSSARAARRLATIQ